MSRNDVTHSVVLNSQVYSKIYVEANKRNIFAQLIYCFTLGGQQQL